jgi:hypothetical protein
MSEFVYGILMEMYHDAKIPEISESAFSEAIKKAFPGVSVKIKGYEVDED